MTALPDTHMPEGPLRIGREIPAHYVEALPGNALRRTAARVGGAALLAAAVGLWLVPALPGDALMQLSKLALSAGMAIGGAVLLMRAQRREGPEVQIDTSGRRLKLIERDARGEVCAERCHLVDDLQEIVLRDNLLTARDARGNPLLALPVRDPAVEAALRKMLAEGRT